jgi:hypothetical protein
MDRAAIDHDRHARAHRCQRRSQPGQETSRPERSQRQFVRVEASAIAHGEECTVIGLEAVHRGAEVDGSDGGRRVDPAGWTETSVVVSLSRRRFLVWSIHLASLTATEMSQGRRLAGSRIVPNFLHAMAQAA